MNPPAQEVIPFGKRWPWLDLGNFESQLDSHRSTEALRTLTAGGPRLNRTGILRAWAWLGDLLDSWWGLTGHIRAAGHHDETSLLDVLAEAATQCRATAVGNPIDPGAWEHIRAASEAAPLAVLGPRRWTLFHALTSVHNIADIAGSHRMPAGQIAVVEAFTALLGLVDSEEQRQQALRQAITEWFGPETFGVESR